MGQLPSDRAQSALAFHDITTQIPHAVSIALERGAESPRIDHPPVSVHRFSHESLMAGIEEHLIDGVNVRVYSPKKTLADCFKFRNQLGMDIVLEALKLYKARKAFNVGELLRYARICRVEAVMRPYIEAILSIILKYMKDNTEALYLLSMPQQCVLVQL